VAPQALSGVVLVGGASSRFGSPKALAQLDGETFVDRARRILGEVCDEVLVVGKAGELPFDVIDDASEVRAPIAGVVAGLHAATNDVVVFLPVDCPASRQRSCVRSERHAVTRRFLRPAPYQVRGQRAHFRCSKTASRTVR